MVHRVSDPFVRWHRHPTIDVLPQSKVWQWLRRRNAGEASNRVQTHHEQDLEELQPNTEMVEHQSRARAGFHRHRSKAISRVGDHRKIAFSCPYGTCSRCTCLGRGVLSVEAAHGQWHIHPVSTYHESS